MIDRSTGRSRGFGFVRFATGDAVDLALQSPHLLDGAWIDVKRAQPADTLPPPKYPRTRAEEKQAKDAGRKKGKARAKAEAPQMPLPEVVPDFSSAMAANWAMWSLFSIAQQNAYAATPFGFPPVMPGMAAPAPELSALLAQMNLDT